MMINRMVLPLNRYRAKPYAVKEQAMSCPIVVITVIKTELKKYNPKGWDFHAAAKFPHRHSLGKKRGGYAFASASVLNTVSSIYINGNKK
jgi:hypothetical protein